ncbi:MAG: DUF3179 domain-containing protein [Chloroflexota bacterium]|nr:MAG: DUF3179 domain-containing protein [Chloroflexota bacterium]
MKIVSILKPNRKWLIASIIFITACAGAVSTQPGEQTGEEIGEQIVEEIAPEPTEAQESTPEAEDENETAGVASVPKVIPDFLPDEPPPLGAERQFSTDFSRHIVPYREILSGGPPKDGIPAVDDPKFISVAEASEFLGELEPVVFFQIGDDARAYPLQILTWHEIVNDVVDGTPVTITFCPLCNTAIAFSREFDGQVLDFGTTGRLRFSNLIMYDRQSETWWQQATGQAIAGEYTGEQLTFLPASIIGWQEFQENFPDGQVLSRDTGFRRDYGRNPYAGYDNINNSPFLFQGPETPGVLPAMARVLTVELDEEAVAYPYEALQELNVINDTIAGSEVVIFWQPGTASALDSSAIAQGEDVGAGVSFSREVDGQILTFSFDGEKIIDDQTGSEWDVFGQAVSGELAGTQLEPVVSVNHFWFSWAAFKPETRVYTG